ncbi:hypothetical protein ACRS5A_18770 [Acinetobacter baumannii]|uniref:hypothetical protein n=1 Tax=Acinetobacter baumannii TaxID=470 RepID=UPI003B34CF38
MRIVLSNSTVISMNRLVTAVIRSDCLPVPLTIEFQVILNDELIEQLKEGNLIYISENYQEMKIIKAVVNKTSIVQGDERVTIGSFIAILSGCEKLINPAPKAIFLENTSIGGALRAAGIKVHIYEDVPLLKFFIPFGETPTYLIGRALGEEAAAMFLFEGKIAIRRLSNITQAEPKLKLDVSAVNWVNNPNEVLHSIPSYVTVNEDGKTLEGEIKPGQSARFHPSLDARRLKNLSTALVVKGTAQRSLSPTINAGDIIQVENEKYVVLTAAHRFDSGALGDATVAASKFWLAQVVTV